jgi:cell division protein FtsB
MNTLLQKPAQTIEWFRSKRRKLATGAVGFLACWLAVHVLFGANGFITYINKRSEYQSLQKEIGDMKAENERISSQIKQLKTDPQSIEKEAREQLRYARPGEVVLVAPESRPNTQTVASPSRK